MVLFELVGTENNKIYQELAASNGARQYDFLRSLVLTALQSNQLWLSQQVLKALNYQAIACLHTNPGEFRPCPVMVGEYRPPEHFQVPALMDQYINQVNANWNQADPVFLAAHVLWRLNNIHPFINGNGRTARAAAYFVLCVKLGGLLPGEKILPELLRENRDEYVAALQHADRELVNNAPDLSVLHQLLVRLIEEQVGIPVGQAVEPEDMPA